LTDEGLLVEEAVLRQVLFAETFEPFASEILAGNWFLVFYVGVLKVASQGGLAKVGKKGIGPLARPTLYCSASGRTGAAGATQDPTPALVYFHQRTHVQDYMVRKVHISGIYSFSDFIPQLL
jgi:hypothetical protein